MQPTSSAALLILISVVFVGHADLIGAEFYVAPILFGLLFIAILAQCWGVIHTVLIFALAALFGPILSYLGIQLRLPVLPLLIPLVVSSLVIWSFPKTRLSVDWPIFGKLDSLSVTLTVFTGVGSAIALLLWASWTDSMGIGKQMMEGMLTIPVWLLTLIAVPVFALFNATTEEAIFRGILQSSLEKTAAPFVVTNFIQASAFAALHFAVGFPNGYIGYLMVLVYGLMLGYIKHHSRGLGAPIIAHIVADLVIGYVMLVSVL